MTDFRTCRDCGASFKKSRADRTVRCSDCRARSRRVVAGVERFDPARAARARVRAIRVEHGSDSDKFRDAYAEYVAAFGDPADRA